VSGRLRGRPQAPPISGLDESVLRQQRAIEGRHCGAPTVTSLLGDEIVCEVGRSRLVRSQRSRHPIGGHQPDVSSAVQGAKHAQDLTPRQPIASVKNPRQLGKHDVGDEKGVLSCDDSLHEGSRAQVLILVVPHDVADQDIGVQSSSVTPVFDGVTIPARDCRSTVRGRISTTPFAISWKSIRSPGFRPRESRSSFGMVICPLLVNVLEAMACLLTS